MPALSSLPSATPRAGKPSIARRLLTGLLLPLSLLAACEVAPPFEGVGRPAPPGAPPGTCWDAVIIPARIETVTEQVMVSPAVKTVDGRVLQPAVFATETRQEITQPREERFFEIPCPQVQTQEYLSSLQRALAARGLYRGAITGTLSAETRAAIRAYQTPLGIDSPSLSLKAARELGLSAILLD